MPFRHRSRSILKRLSKSNPDDRQFHFQRTTQCNNKWREGCAIGWYWRQEEVIVGCLERARRVDFCCSYNFCCLGTNWQGAYQVSTVRTTNVQRSVFYPLLRLYSRNKNKLPSLLGQYLNRHLGKEKRFRESLCVQSTVYSADTNSRKCCLDTRPPPLLLLLVGELTWRNLESK